MHESLYEPFVEKFVEAVKVCPSGKLGSSDLDVTNTGIQTWESVTHGDKLGTSR